MPGAEYEQWLAKQLKKTFVVKANGGAVQLELARDDKGVTLSKKAVPLNRKATKGR